MFRKKVTGSLVVTDDSGDVTRVFLREGLPVHAERPTDIDRLDRILTTSGLIPPEVIAEANQEVVATGRRLGEILVRRGAIEREALAEVLKTQMRRKVTRLFFARDGSFEVFTEAHHFGDGDEFALMRVDPRAILYPGIRAAYDDERLTRELAPLAGHTFKLISVPAAFLEAMGFGTADITLAALRQRAVMLEEIPIAGAKPAESRSVVLALLYSDLLEATPIGGARSAGAPAKGAAGAAGGASDPLADPVVATPDRERRITFTQMPVYSAPAAPAAANAAPASAPPVASPFPPPAQPAAASAVRNSSGSMPAYVPPTSPAAAAPARPTRSSSPVAPLGGPTPPPPSATGGAGAAESIRSALVDLHGKLENLSYFELLGVGENATVEEVNAAYMRAVRQFHPDRLAAAGLREMAPTAERVMARMGEASSVLRDKNRRGEYVANRAGKKSEVSAAVSIVDAEKTFQKGEVFLRKGDYAKAIESFSEAVKVNPAEPQYRAYLAWTRFDDPRARKDVVARESLSTLQHILRDSERFARGHYWVGQIWKYLNDMDKAERAFREAIKHDKTFLEAEREIRLLEMRRAKATQARPTTQGPTTATRQTGGLLGKLFKRDE